MESLRFVSNQSASVPRGIPERLFVRGLTERERRRALETLQDVVSLAPREEEASMETVHVELHYVMCVVTVTLVAVLLLLTWFVYYRSNKDCRSRERYDLMPENGGMRTTSAPSTPSAPSNKERNLNYTVKRSQFVNGL